MQRIILTRPAVEAGERLGFLPGDLAQKVDPYLRPLYDALYDLMGLERVGKAFEKGTLEVAPLAFMRGRTLNHAFVILDEAQNTTPEQMKMFLTRIGFGAKAVVTGDISQIDLPQGTDLGADRRRARAARVSRASRRRASPRPTWCAIRWSRASSRPMTRPTQNAADATRARAAGRRCSLSLQFADAPPSRRCSPRADVARWIRAALAAPAEITVRIVGDDEGRRSTASTAARTTRPTC